MDPRDELAKALRDEAAGVPRPAPRKRQRQLRKVSENCERKWVSPRCGGEYLQWQMKK